MLCTLCTSVEIKPIDRDCALILIGYRVICLCGVPALGAGCRGFKSLRPDQPPFETELRKEAAAT